MGTAQEESLRNQLQVMKDRMKEMEELFSAQDEESRQLIQELKNEQKISSHKMRDLEKTILNLNFEKADLVQQLETLATSKPSTETETKLHTTFTLSDSMAQQYDDLHEKVDALETQNAQLRDQLKESQNQHQLLSQTISDRDKQCEDQKLTIESMNKDFNRLNRENNELRESVNILQSQLDMISTGTGEACERGNSMFNEVNEARLKAETELKKIVERNVFLESELEEANIRYRRLQHSALTHADQSEIDFQKTHSEKMYSELQEAIKVKEQFAHEIQELTKKLAATQGSETGHMNFAMVTLQRQLEARNKELAKLRNTCDDQSIKLHDLGLRVSEIPKLNNSIRRLESKQAALEDQLRIAKGTADLTDISSPSEPVVENNENKLPNKPKSLGTPSDSPRIDSRKVRLDIFDGSRWANRLTKNYKETARNSNRERSLDPFRRDSRSLSSKNNRSDSLKSNKYSVV